MKKRVLVIGATGLVGKAITRQLNEDGFEVSVLTRKPEKASQLFSPDIRIITGDVREEATLSGALENQEYVYINLPDVLSALAMPSIVKACKEHYIKQICYTSGCTVRKENAVHPMISNHLTAEKILKASGLNYTLFRPTMIMDTLPVYAHEGKPFIIGKQPHGWSWIHTSDIASTIANGLGNKMVFNKSLTLWGPEKWTFFEATEQFNAHFFPGSKKAKATPVWFARIIALIAGNKLKYAISIFKYFSTHTEEGNPEECWELLGKPKMTIQQFIENYNSKN